MIDTIAFDADDTLWHNESIFLATGERFKRLLAPYCSADLIEAKLYETESANLAHFGYGIKSFVLSMIETAVMLTNGRIPANDILTLVNFAKEMRQHPLALLPHVSDVVSKLSQTYSLMIITKGDLFDQETKVALSGLADYFEHVEIVSEKDVATYAALFTKYGLTPERVLMVGNSIRSDILPVLDWGGTAVHIPYETTWIHEQAGLAHKQTAAFHTLNQISQLPELVYKLSS